MQHKIEVFSSLLSIKLVLKFFLFLTCKSVGKDMEEKYICSFGKDLKKELKQFLLPSEGSNF